MDETHLEGRKPPFYQFRLLTLRPVAPCFLVAQNSPMPSVAPIPDPVLLALANAPVDDEPETDDERQAVESSKAELRSGGRLFTHEEVRKHWLDK